MTAGWSGTDGASAMGWASPVQEQDVNAMLPPSLAPEAVPDQTAPDRPPRPPLIVILGPTASGKSALAMHLAGRLPAEIVNADSRAFYRGMDIGTAKPSSIDRERVVHHLVDILDPAEPMSLATFQDLASQSIRDVHARSRLPLLVGGTPQYVNAVVENWSIPRVPPDDAFRARLEEHVAQGGVGPLLARVRAVDPVAAARIGPNPRRLIRALEVYEATGTPISEQQGIQPSPWDALEIELQVPRDVLYRRIDDRVDRMIAAGLIEEVAGLLAAGVPADAPALSAIGYRQLVPLIQGEIDREEAIRRVRFDTHQMVRSQLTWFRRNTRVVAVDADAPDLLDRIEALVHRHAGAWLRS